MLTHVFYGLSERVEVEHGGETLTIRVERESLLRGSAYEVAFTGPGSFRVFERGRWRRIEHRGESLHVLVGHRGKETPFKIYLDGPRSFRVRFEGHAPVLAGEGDTNDELTKLGFLRRKGDAS